MTGFDAGHAGDRRRGRRKHARVAGEQLNAAGARREPRRPVSRDSHPSNEPAYLVSCWRKRLRSCRTFPTLAQARAAAARHVHDAADAFGDDAKAPADDYGFRAAADWARELDPQQDETTGRDLADGTRIRVRVVSAETARCLR
jgi:hypothetical protein